MIGAGGPVNTARMVGVELVTVNVVGLLVPFAIPLHVRNEHPELGTAVAVTTVPYGTGLLELS